MKEWFDSLEERERNLLLMLGGVLIIAVLYFAIYQPLTNKLTLAKEGVAREQQLLSWVEKNATKLALLRANSGVSANANGGSLEQIINSTARRYQLTINRIQPQSNKLQVSLDSASFVTLLQWIQELQLSSGMVIEIADFRPLAAPGLVKTRLVVSK